MNVGMTTKGVDSANVELVSDREILISREFNAPRRLVFEALTKPEHVKRWYGLKVLALHVCEIDLRPGGTWRYVLRAPDGSEYGFTGVYREIVKPERIVYTENYEARMPGHEALVTTTLEETNGRTKLKTAISYPSKADRDAHIASGMEGGMRESFERMADLLLTLT